MSSIQAVTPDGIASLVAKLAGLRWSWSLAEIDQTLARSGWRRATELQEHGAVLSVGNDSVSGYADLQVRDGVAVQLRFMLTRGARAADGDDVRRDVFATVARVATEAVGPPSARIPGAKPEVRWEVSSGVLQTVDNGTFVEVSLLARHWLDWLDEMADEENEGDDW
ncbi:DUF6301 family protein [Plantactinospora sp. GCM10030261]|uniref:DUF6301 family protein n=1 Tax=Plantactinospora sp. GCM10030261 TaxID=3273420 RepID=UPI0036160F65